MIREPLSLLEMLVIMQAIEELKEKSGEENLALAKTCGEIHRKLLAYFPNLRDRKIAEKEGKIGLCERCLIATDSLYFHSLLLLCEDCVKIV